MIFIFALPETKFHIEKCLSKVEEIVVRNSEFGEVGELLVEEAAPEEESLVEQGLESLGREVKLEGEIKEWLLWRRC